MRDLAQPALDFGGSNTYSGVSTSRTLMLNELSALLASTSPGTDRDGYKIAVVDDNVLLKPSVVTRSKTYAYLRDRFALDPAVPVFKTLRLLWDRDPAGQPLMALLVAAFRDPLLRATLPGIIACPPDHQMTYREFAQIMSRRFPDRFGAKTVQATSERLVSTYKQSGHLQGRANCTRRRVSATPGSTTIALLLATLAAFAQYYSDNLSFEVRKGKAERKAQGLFNGVLPFGLKTNPDGIPVPDPETYPGLLLAFRLAAEGKSDRVIAEAINAAGYRTTGNGGRNLFTKDTVCRLLKNRFYLGELPDGNGGWISAIHQPVLDAELFARALAARRANQSGSVKVPRVHRRHSLSGLGVCGHCGGRLHILTPRDGKARIYCYHRRQAATCAQKSAHLSVIEEQLASYLATFQLPTETVDRIVAMYERAADDRDDSDRRRREIDGRLERIAELYKWGDVTREAYQAERDQLQGELATLRGEGDWAQVLGQAAAFLRDLPAAWAAGTPEQCNDLARLVFESVEVRDDRVLAVIPRPDFAPFFVDRVQQEGRGNENTPGDTGGVNREIEEAEATGVASASSIIRALATRRSLRSLAAEFDVSHETIRTIRRECNTAGRSHTRRTVGAARADALLGAGR